MVISRWTFFGLTYLALTLTAAPTLGQGLSDIYKQQQDREISKAQECNKLYEQSQYSEVDMLIDLRIKRARISGHKLDIEIARRLEGMRKRYLIEGDGTVFEIDRRAVSTCKKKYGVLNQTVNLLGEPWSGGFDSRRELKIEGDQLIEYSKDADGPSWRVPLNKVERDVLGVKIR